MFDTKDTVRLQRDTYHDGSASHYYGIVVNGEHHKIYMHEPFRPSFQPFGRFFVFNRRDATFTEHRIIVDKDREALLQIDDNGTILNIGVGGKELSFFDVPKDHEFWKFAFTRQPASNLFEQPKTTD